jgi:type IV secretion system protein VirB2
MIPDVAAAAAAAGGGMPYSSGLQKLRQSITGEVAGIMIIIGVVAGGVVWMAGGELNGLLSFMARAVMVIGLVGGIAAFLTMAGVSGALI